MLNYNFVKSLLDYNKRNNKQIVKLIWSNIAYVLHRPRAYVINLGNFLITQQWHTSSFPFGSFGAATSKLVEVFGDCLERFLGPKLVPSWIQRPL